MYILTTSVNKIPKTTGRFYVQTILCHELLKVKPGLKHSGYSMAYQSDKNECCEIYLCAEKLTFGILCTHIPIQPIT